MPLRFISKESRIREIKSLGEGVSVEAVPPSEGFEEGAGASSGD
jgi:hypothetical protein